MTTDTKLTGDPKNIETLEIPTERPPSSPANLSAEKELQKWIGKVASSKPGQRNDILNKAAYSLGGFIASGRLERERVESKLLAAIGLVGGGGDIDAAKIRAGIDAGMAAPRPAAPLALALPASAGDGRPLIYMASELHENVDAASSALARDPEIFQRDGKLVQVLGTSREEVEASPMVESYDGPRHQLVEGTPQIRDLAPASVRERLTKNAQFRRFSKTREDWDPALPSDAIVSAVHARGRWSRVPVLVGVSEAPFMRVDGTIFQKPGYDLQSQYLYRPSRAFPSVPDKPTQSEARAALALLAHEIYGEFPFVNEGHRSVPIAAILTLVGRPAIRGAVPGYLFDANTRGAGKSLQTDTIAMVATGRPMPRMSFPPNDEELGKCLGSYALKGSAVVSFDNINREFGGGPLDAALTASDTVEFRVLGQSVLPTLHWRAVVFGTGNNLALSGDTSDRVLITRLESELENPRTRTGFRHPHLLDWIGANRGALVVAALTVLRAYVVAGRPDMGCPRWGSYEAWSSLIPNAIVYAGGADPMVARVLDETTVNDSLRYLACVLSELLKLQERRESTKNANGPPGSTAKEIIDAVYGGYASWPGASALKAAIEGLCNPKQRSAASDWVPAPQILGLKFNSYKGRVQGGLKLVSEKRPADGMMLWRVEKAGRTSVEMPASPPPKKGSKRGSKKARP